MTTLRRILFAFLAAASVAAAVPTDAFARDNGFAEGVVAGAILGGALAQPGPTYGYPPPVVYQAPAPYYQAPPVYVPAPIYAPAPVYYPPPSVIYVPEPGYGHHHRHHGW